LENHFYDFAVCARRGSVNSWQEDLEFQQSFLDFVTTKMTKDMEKLGHQLLQVFENKVFGLSVLITSRRKKT
jgi:hypothetical protein